MLRIQVIKTGKIACGIDPVVVFIPITRNTIVQNVLIGTLHGKMQMYAKCFTSLPHVTNALSGFNRHIFRNPISKSIQMRINCSYIFAPVDCLVGIVGMEEQAIAKRIITGTVRRHFPCNDTVAPCVDGGSQSIGEVNIKSYRFRLITSTMWRILC